MSTRETDIRRQVAAIGTERAELARTLDGVLGRVKTRDSGRGYDEPAPTSAQTKEMKELGAKIAKCDEALAALHTLT